MITQSNTCQTEANQNQHDEYPFEVQNVNFPITTSSEKSQTWFERGLLQCYNFNHEETIYCCDRALEYDAECPMIYFLKSFAIGINYNNYPEELDPIQAKLQYENCQMAIKYMKKATSLEQKLILALKERVGDGVTLKHSDYDYKFSDKMKAIYEEYPNNEYVIGFYVESMMNLSPWNFWVQTPSGNGGNQKYGDPCFEKTLQIKEVLDLAIKQFPNNFGLRHFFVHFMESSSTPEVALDSCFENKMVDVAKDYSHLLHTPSHVDLVIGQYDEAIYQNELAVQANYKYFEWRKKVNKPVVCFNTYYRVHASHFIAYSAMLSGNYQKAVEASKDMIKVVPECVLTDTKCFKPSGAHWCESYLPTLLHVYIRFGKWEEIISQEPFGVDVLPIKEILDKPDIYVASNSTLVYSRGIAYAVLAGKAKTDQEKIFCLQESEKCLNQLKILVEKIPSSWKLLKNKFNKIMLVGVEMLAGEYYYRIEEYDKAFQHLRKSVELYDVLNYDEPWGWMMPTRHPLGALLLEYGVFQKNKNAILEAIQAYREDLGEINEIPKAITHPHNLWSLLGLIQCYKQLNIIEKSDVIDQNVVDKVQREFDSQVAKSDLKIKSSCFCTIKNLF